MHHSCISIDTTWYFSSRLETELFGIMGAVQFYTYSFPSTYSNFHDPLILLDQRWWTIWSFCVFDADESIRFSNRWNFISFITLASRECDFYTD